MVFESIVAELLNKTLGEYVKNLDHTQLKLSLWGGDVVLKDLMIKESALDVLDLPVKLEYGRLGKLILKIPFKDMWNGQIDAIIEELFILIVPTSQSKYDAEKEEKLQLEAKRAEILRVEKQKLLSNTEKQEKLDDSMVEKLIARMIKNIHVEIKKIHVRYEDHVTFKNHPFSFGFTLNNFTLESCTDGWTTTGNLKDMYAIPQIYKLCTLDGLAAYLNTTLEQLSKRPESEYSNLFTNGIATTNYNPPNYYYLLGPINVKAKLKLNPKPETDGSNYTIPKLWLDIDMQILRIGLTKKQYQTLVQLGEGLERAQKALPYRKYRPDLTSYRGHYKEWWKFAYKCILEETVRRNRNNWNWDLMKRHRDTCRAYAKTYQTKLTTKKVVQNIEQRLTELEKNLDIFNLVLIRQQIEMEVEKLAEQEKTLKAQRGWFGFLWTSNQAEQAKELNSAAAIMKKFEEAMTPTEKEKLYQAIGYQENSAPAHYPETFEMIDARFFLHGLQIILSDTDGDRPHVLDLHLKGVDARFKSRPSANAILVTTSVADLKILGVKQGDCIPSLFNYEAKNSEVDLISVSYEKNPIDKLCGDRIIVKAKSVNIIYDAQTIIELADLFKIQNDATLTQLQAAAAERLEEFKEKSALGLEYAIEKHSVLDIQIDLQASQLILPHGGLYDTSKSLFIINLGSLKIHSVDKPTDGAAGFTVRRLLDMGKSEKDVLDHLRHHSYDKFVLKIVDFQVLTALTNENWRDALGVEDSPLALLRPTTLEIQFHKCLITDDPLLPKMRLIGQLPSISIIVTDLRLLETLAIVQSIPFPEEKEPNLQENRLTKSVSQLSIFKEYAKPVEDQQAPVKQHTNLELKFVMKELTLTVSKKEDTIVTPFIRFEVLQLEAEMIQRNYDQEIMLRLGGIQMKQYHDKGEIFMINTPMSVGKDEYLIVVDYVNVNRKSPEFTTRHGSVVQLLKLNFTTLDILLHQEGLINLLKFTTTIQDQIQAISTRTRSREDIIIPTRPNKLSIIQEETTMFLKDQKQKLKIVSTSPRRRKTVVQVIDLKIQANVSSISIKMASDYRDITGFYIEGIKAGYLMKSSYSQANVTLTSINVQDLNTMSIYKNIVAVEGSETLQIQAVIYNIEPEEIDKTNMSVKIIMGRHRIVFLNAFVTGVMNFLNNFQTALEAIGEASAAAAEAAKTNIKDVQQSATRIELGVDIKAPVIYVPMNSKDNQCLMLDMGNLIVNNACKKLEVTSESGEFAIVDEMRIELQNLKLSRVKLNVKTFNVEKEVLLLEPVSFTLLVKRNLSTGWFNSIPDIDMSGRLKNINLLLSKEDYASIMAALEGNLGEEPIDPKPAQSLTSNVKKSQTRESQLQRHSDKIEVSVNRESGPREIEQKTIHTFIKFEFIMDSLIINLYTGGSKMLTSEGSPLRLPENGLAKFGLTHFAVKGRIFVDGLLATSVLLMNCTLDDTRHNRQGSLTRIMERTTAVPNVDEIETKNLSIRSMLDVTLRQSLNDTFVDLRIFSFSIIVSLEYLMKIKDFFDYQSEQNQTIPQVATTKKKSSQPTSISTKTLTINLHVEKPDIILLEDMDDINSNCIVLNTELLLKLRLINEHQVITGSIKDFSITTGIYSPEKRRESIYQVLKPCSVSVAGSTPEDKGLHVDVCCTDIHLSVSPGVIEILNKVIQTVTKTVPEDTQVMKIEPNHEGLWKTIDFQDTQHWFLKTEFGIEAFELDTNSPTENEINERFKPELAIVSAPVILFTLEAGVGNKTLPMLFLHIDFQTTINNWSSNFMNIESSLSVVMAYYNSRLALWEPLIEPIEGILNDRRISTPWELKTKIQFNELLLDSKCGSPLSPLSENEAGNLQQIPKMSIDVTSRENLEITVSKTCLDVLTQLGTAFTTAMESGGEKTTRKISPFVLKNQTGLTITLDLENSNFKLFEDEKLISQVILETGAAVELAAKQVHQVHLLEQFKAETIKDTRTNKLIVSFKEIGGTLTIPVLRADKRFFSLKYRKESSEEWGIVSDVVVEEGSTIVTLRSVLQVHNHFNEPVSVYYMTRRGNEVECVGTVGPDERLNLPLDAVYTPTNIYWLFFSVDGHMVSLEPFVWKDLQKTISMTKLLKCEARTKEEKTEPFYIQVIANTIYSMIVIASIIYNPDNLGLLFQWEPKFFNNKIKTLTPNKYLKTPIQVVGEIEQVYYQTTNRYTMASTIYNVHLYPSVYLKNFLPIDITICLPCIPEEIKLEASETLQISTIDPNKSSIVIKLLNYIEKDWSCRGEIIENPKEFSVWSFESFDSSEKVVMDLGMHTSYKHGSIIMELYCPFWMLNKTGLMLCYRKSSKGGKVHSSPIKNAEDDLNVLYHPETYKGPILFSFRSKAFFGKKTAMIRVEDGDWSDKFSIDVAGSTGVISCRYNGKTHQIGVHNQLTYNSLTKQITFTPYFILINNAPFAIECQEGDRPADPSIKVSSGECVALWPNSDHQEKTLKAKVSGSDEKTANFIYTDIHTTLLKLDNKYGGINVDVQINESGAYISMSEYTAGNAPALMINHTPYVINYWEKGSLNVRSLKSFNQIYYTWENPAGLRKLIWEDGKKKEIVDDLKKDNLGTFKTTESKEQLYYVSFLDGTQRILLFTTNLKIAEDCQLVGDLEIIDQEITINIHGVGLSLVNNLTKTELLYMRIASSGIIWETCKFKGNRWLPLSTREIDLIEEGFQIYARELQIGKDPVDKVVLDQKLMVDYANMELLKPSHRSLRRTFQTGLWFQYRTSAHQVQLHAKINRLQIDNQLSDCLFPVILAPVPPPKSIVQTSAMKPFAEMSMVKRLLEHSTVQQFRYFKVLVQEFHIKVDIVFINALMVLFEANQVNDAEESKLFRIDMKLVNEPLMHHVSLVTSAEQKNFFDLLHFSPLKIHISFSMSGSGGGPSALPQVLNVLLQGIGVTLTDINDIVFKLQYFERTYTFMTHKQLVSEATSHYAGQAIKQAYVLVLGLDVIGNPYGLVLGTMKGIEDLFYEPFQGAIQGPGEFAEGLYLGVRSILGHTVGGMAGAVSKITGAVGKGLAALTFDDEYQKKRQQQLNKQPANIQEGLARSGKGLVMGVFDGITGVVTKPVSGAREEGVEGFFKGFGKGVVGLVTRPTAGVIDFASGSFGAVRRAADLTEEVKRVRPPRFFQLDGLVKPYVKDDAEGNKILQDLEKGKYANTDLYLCHTYVNKHVVLLTDKRMVCVEHNDLFGGWKVDWTHPWTEIGGVKIVEKGIQIMMKDLNKKKRLSLFSTSDQSKILMINDPTIKQLFCNKIQEQINQYDS